MQAPPSACNLPIMPQQRLHTQSHAQQKQHKQEQHQEQGQQAFSIKLLLKPYDERSKWHVSSLGHATQISIPISKWVRLPCLAHTPLF